MKLHWILTTIVTTVAVLTLGTACADDPSFYVKKDTWHETMLNGIGG